MKRIAVLILIPLFVATTIIGIFPGRVEAAFNRHRLVDDVVFNKSNSMSIEQIDAFLNDRGSCISTGSGFSARDPIGYSPSGGFQYGGNVSAGTIIAHSAQVYDLNPQVLIVTLQKEQSLITSTSCNTNTIAKAMGYGCPDSYTSNDYSGLNLYTRNGTTYTSVEGICVNAAPKAGFTQQVIRAAWLLKFSQQRSLGRVDWAIIEGNWDNSDDLDSCYSGYMTQGTFRRGPNYCGPETFYDGWTTIDGTATHMDTGATASLYRYTPHFNGNQNFVSLFESWFGNPQIDTNQDTPLVGDWDGDGTDTTGVRRDNMYYLDNDNDGDVDWEYGFGLSTDQHLIGDWDGDGSDEIGLKRGERYYFSTDFNGTSEIYQGFGNPTDKALVGDWDGDGSDSIGLKRGSIYYLDNNYDGQAEIYQGFGNPTDQAFVGDWDDDDRDEIGLKRGEWYYISFDYDGQAEKIFGYGSAEHKVIVGDWDGNGSDDMGLKRGEFYYLDTDLNGDTEIYTGIGVSTDRTVIGDWNDDDIESIGIKRASQYFLDNNFDGAAETVFTYKY